MIFSPGERGQEKSFGNFNVEKIDPEVDFLFVFNNLSFLLVFIVHFKTFLGGPKCSPP